MNRDSRALASVFELKCPWSKTSPHVWIGSQINIKRNLKPYKFPGKEDISRKQHINNLVISALKECPDLHQPESISSDVDFGVKEYLLEHFLVSEEFYQVHEHESFVFDSNSRFLATVNFKDHIQFTYLETTQELEHGWNDLIKIEGDVGKRLEYAFNPRFGFLTSDPNESGTALHVTLFLHIPSIIQMGSLPELIDHVNEEGVEVRTLQGTMQDVVGDLLLVRNKSSLGISEESLITSMRLWAAKAVVAEMNLRKQLINQQDLSMKTKITRALGLLIHSYQLELVEALNALSLVKLGVEIGWIEAPNDLNLNALLFGCRRAHLMRALNEKFNLSDLPQKRALYLKEIAQKLKLKL